MKIQTVLIIGLAAGVIGCSEKEQAAPMEETAAPVAAVEEAVEAAVEDESSMGTMAFLEHMHHHASQLGQLNAALEVGSLAAAQRPAYWLSGHEEVSGVPEGWQVFIDGMRDAANGVDSARDIKEARAAALQIEASCRGCHAAAGVDVADLRSE